MNMIKRSALAIVLLVVSAGAATAGNADKAIQTCKTAIAEAEGSAYAAASLKKLKTTGKNYETWFNISDGDLELKSYCQVKSGKVRQLVTEEGRWTSNNPQRPEAERES